MKSLIFVIASLGSLLLIATASAQTNNSYPMLMSVKPAAAQIGQTTEHEVNARYNLYGAYQVIVAGEGVKGEVVPPEKKEGEKPPETKPVSPKAKIRFIVAADAVPGVRDFRIITPQGASTVGQIVIARDPIISETADNDVAAKAQEITLPATVCGAIEKAEDLDFFKFKVEAGTALTFHVRSQRLLNRLHDMQIRVDPMITLRNSTGSTLATSDNYYAGDPLLFHKFDQAGEYLLEIRDVRYQGNGDWTYSIEINNRPFITQALPLALKPGVETKFSLVGYNLPADASAVLNLPAETPAGMRWVSPPVGGQAANEFAVLVTGLATTAEAPVSAAVPAGAADVNLVATAQPFTIPTVINGRIDNQGEIDRFVFEAKAGDKRSFEVTARRAQSGLDPIIRILNDKGAALSEVDDMTFHRVGNADSWLENWAAPADGKYLLEIRDLHLRGGLQYTYAVEVTRSEPYLHLEADTDKTLLTPGISAVFYVRGLRKNGFAGDIQLGVEGLPPGVTAVCGQILANANDGCVVLTAAANAPAGAVNIRITGSADASCPQWPAAVADGGRPDFAGILFSRRRPRKLPRRPAHRFGRRPDGYSRRETQRDGGHSQARHVTEDRSHDRTCPGFQGKRYARRPLPAPRTTVRQQPAERGQDGRRQQ